MDDKEMIAPLARSLYWGFVKETKGTPGKWADLDGDGRKVWLAVAQRALRRVDELRSAPSHAHLTSERQDAPATPPPSSR